MFLNDLLNLWSLSGLYIDTEIEFGFDWNVNGFEENRKDDQLPTERGFYKNQI